MKKSFFIPAMRPKRVVTYKDRYCVNFSVGDKRIVVNKLDSSVSIDGKIFAKDKCLAEFVIDFACYDGEFSRLSGMFADFLVEIGWYTRNRAEAKTDPVFDKIAEMLKDFKVTFNQ